MAETDCRSGVASVQQVVASAVPKVTVVVATPESDCALADAIKTDGRHDEERVDTVTVPQSNVVDVQEGEEEEEDDEEEEESDDSDDSDDDMLSGLTEEQKKLIRDRTKALQSNFSNFVQVQTASKVEDVITATGVEEALAVLALECCNDDEMEAVNRLSSVEFLSFLQGILEERAHLEEIGSSAQVRVTVNRDGEFERHVQGHASGARRKRKTAPPRARASSSSTAGVPLPGFNMDGSKRAKNLRLNDALAQLVWIKQAKARAAADAQPDDNGRAYRDEAASADNSSVTEDLAKDVAKHASNDLLDGSTAQGADDGVLVIEEEEEKEEKEGGYAEAMPAVITNGNRKRVSLKNTIRRKKITMSASEDADTLSKKKGSARNETSSTASSQEEEETPKVTQSRVKTKSAKVVSGKQKAKSVEDLKNEVGSSDAATKTKPSKRGKEKKVGETKESGDGLTEAEEGEGEDPFDGLTEDELASLGWSNARVQAFMQRKENPNAYYYRFNAPGEVQATGGWNREQHDLFLTLIVDGVDYHWGLLSMRVPGRVGYQCSNYYRKLIHEGVIEDPNYTIQENGKLKFTRPPRQSKLCGTTGKSNRIGVTVDQAAAGAVINASTQRKAPIGVCSSSSSSSSSSSASAPSTARRSIPVTQKKRRKKPAAKRRKKRNDDSVYADEVNSSEDEGEAAAYVPVIKQVRPEDEVVPGLRCPMTCEPMSDPALSPFGHVMSYDTWLRVLKRKPMNTCPFTKQKLTRRMLVKITKDNLHEYKDKFQHVQVDASMSRSA